MRLRFESASESFVMRSLMGLGTMGTLLLIFGLCGLFYPVVLWMVFGLGVILGIPWKGRVRIPRTGGFLVGSRGAFSLLLAILSLGVVVLTFFRLNLPVITADELSYHLYLPKIFLLKHWVFYWPYHVNSVFPLLTEMLYSWGVSLSQSLAMKGVHFLFGLILSAAVYAISRRVLNGRSREWASLLFLSVPVVGHQMALANNDLALSAFLTGGTLALFRWCEERKPVWLVLAGALSGFAMGVKYLALFSISIQLILIFLELFPTREGRRRILTSWVFFTLPLLVVSAVWYVRSYLNTGNPIYPYLTTFFGGEGLENPLGLESKGLGRGVRALLFSGWHATFSPEAFGGLGNQWGPVFLGFMPWVFLVKSKEKVWRYSLIVLGLTFFSWFYTKQNLRFLLPALPFFCVAVAKILERFSEMGGWVRNTARVFFLVFVGLNVGIAVYPLRDHYRFLLGREGRAEYLTRKEPTYPVAQYVNGTFGKKAKVLSEDHRAYYFDGELVRERAYRRLTHYPEVFRSKERDFYDELRRAGFTHLLLLERPGKASVPFLYDFVRHRQAPGPWATLVYQSSFDGANTSENRRYFLYFIDGSGSPPRPSFSYE